MALTAVVTLFALHRRLPLRLGKLGLSVAGSALVVGGASVLVWSILRQLDPGAYMLRFLISGAIFGVVLVGGVLKLRKRR